MDDTSSIFSSIYVMALLLADSAVAQVQAFVLVVVDWVLIGGSVDFVFLV